MSLPRLWAAALAAAIILPPPAPVQAQNVKRTIAAGVMQAATADDLVAALRAAGASDLETGTDPYGDPLVDGSYEGLNFSVVFYKCDRAELQACGQLQYRVSFDMGLPAAESEALMQAWNRAWIFGKAYVDESGDLLLEHPTYLSGGVTADNLRRNADLWLEMLPDFAAHIGWN